jgi:single-stranded DNA-specific DHH superfamily exonuclease
MINIKEVISPGINFIKVIKPRSKVVIIYGHDTDSISSAAILYRLLKFEMKIKAELLISEMNSHLTENTVKKLKRLSPDYTIIVDISSISIEKMTSIGKFSNIMIIDHHIPKGYTRITYVNPRIYDRESYIPATYLCYKIYENFFNPKEIAWIAGIGVLGDMGMKNCLDLFQKIKTDYKELLDDLKPDDEILMEKSLLGKLTNIVDSGMVVKDFTGSKFSLNVLIEAEKYTDVINNKTLSRYYKLVETEFKRIENDFNKNKKIVDNIIFYEIKSKMKLKSAFSNYLERMFGDKIVVVYQKNGTNFTISVREGRKLKIDLDILAKESVRDINGADGGGHPSAAGARVPLGQINKFMDNLRLRMRLESVKS